MTHNTERAVSRRTVLGVGIAAAVPPIVGIATAPKAAAAPKSDDQPDAAIKQLEQHYQVRIGLTAKNLRTRAAIQHRPTERFPLCSTFKAVAAAAVLRERVDLDHVVRYPESILVENSPVSSERRSMRIAEIIDAAVRYSDNTAGNLMLQQIGGPRGFTRFVRSIGDRVTRLDRWETELNTAYPGDLRDTTTPTAIADTYAKILLGDVLPADRRYFLRATMQGNTTSIGKFRAALPAGWWFADKTGGGDYASRNDVGVTWTPDGAPIVIAALTRSDDPTAAPLDVPLADIAATVCGELG